MWHWHRPAHGPSRLALRVASRIAGGAAGCDRLGPKGNFLVLRDGQAIAVPPHLGGAAESMQEVKPSAQNLPGRYVEIGVHESIDRRIIERTDCVSRIGAVDDHPYEFPSRTGSRASRAPHEDCSPRCGSRRLGRGHPAHARLMLRWPSRDRRGPPRPARGRLRRTPVVPLYPAEATAPSGRRWTRSALRVRHSAHANCAAGRTRSSVRAGKPPGRSATRADSSFRCRRG